MVPGEVSDEALAAFRSFQRALTARIGALDHAYLGRDRPLGASRLLWEIGPSGSELRDLRQRLGLDSGYLSRLLGSLSAEGLVVVERSARDGRVRSARLTARGTSERERLDRLSDELVRSILEPLGEQARAELARAAATVERLLGASLVEIAPADPHSADARFCIGCYLAELDERFEGGFDPARSVPASAEELAPPRGLLLLARLRGTPLGCAGLKLRADAPAEVKRMWVDPAARGMGIGRRLLAAIESAAREAGCPTLRLETNGTLREAVSLYRSCGYREVPAFNDEPYAQHWFEKALAAAPAETGPRLQTSPEA